MGEIEGRELGLFEGLLLGELVGASVSVGLCVGCKNFVGNMVGLMDGEIDGLSEGLAVGAAVGWIDGALDGDTVGLVVGRLVGLLDGSAVGVGSRSILINGFPVHMGPSLGSASTSKEITKGSNEQVSTMIVSDTEAVVPTASGFVGRSERIDNESSPVFWRKHLMTSKLASPSLVTEYVTLASCKQCFSPQACTWRAPNLSFSRTVGDKLTQFFCNSLLVEADLRVQRISEGSMELSVVKTATLSPVTKKGGLTDNCTDVTESIHSIETACSRGSKSSQKARVIDMSDPSLFA